MSNKYLEKIASDEIEGTIHVPKGREEAAARAKARRNTSGNFKKPLEAEKATKGANGPNRKTFGDMAKRFGKLNIGNKALVVGGIATVGAGAYSLVHKKHEKQAGLVGQALGAVKSYAQGAIADASKIGEQVHSLGASVKTNTGIGAAAGNLAKNKAIQTGAGLVGAGAVGGYMAGSKGQTKQSSEKEKPNHVAGFTGSAVGGGINGGILGYVGGHFLGKTTGELAAANARTVLDELGHHSPSTSELRHMHVNKLGKAGLIMGAVLGADAGARAYGKEHFGKQASRDRNSKGYEEALKEDDKRRNKAAWGGLKGGVIGAGLGFGAGALARKLHLGHLAEKVMKNPIAKNNSAIESAVTVGHKAIGTAIGAATGLLTGSQIGSTDAMQDLIHKERSKHTKTASDNKYLEKIIKN